MSKVNSTQKPNIITIRLTSFDKSPEVPDNKAETVKLDLDIDY
jgi:hypothetical protein